MSAPEAAARTAVASRKARAVPFWSGVFTVAAREVGGLFEGRIATVSAIAFTLLANSIFMNEFFLSGRVDMGPWFDLMPLLLPVFLPAVTMRLWAEERKQRTLEMLLTMPIRAGQAVLGKYLAALLLLGLFVAAALPVVVMLLSLGDPDVGLLFSGLLGTLLLGAELIALGMLVSSLCNDQIVAFVSTTVLGLTLVLLGDDRVVAALDGLADASAPGTWLREHVSALPAFDSLVRGLLGVPALVHVVGACVLFLALNAWVLERKRG